MNTAGHRARTVMLAAGYTLMLAAVTGCPQYADWVVPNPIRQQVEPTTSARYLVYTPSGYDDSKAVPLVIVCHGTTPWDTPERQIRDWVKLAEKETFVVAAPFLVGTRGDLPRKPARQIELQKRDERTILGVLRHVSAGHRIKPDRVFLSGWSAGNFDVLYTGLRHPDVFRALAVLQGNFNPDYLVDVESKVDPYQPVFVLYGSTDILTGKQGRRCVQWLYEQKAYVFDYRVAGPHRAHPRRAVDFFSRVVREVPWMHVRWTVPDRDDPYTLKFTTLGSFTPRVYDWDFGDGDRSPVASPEHTFGKSGQYTVTLRARTPDGRRVKRTATVTVPAPRVEHHLAD